MVEQATVVIGDKQWAVDIATTATELATGLSGVESLAPNTGMLFDLGCDYGYLEIDMSRMLFPLDVIFIHSSQGVAGVLKDVQPKKSVFFDAGTMPGARFFLEVNAGEADGIKSEDDVVIQGDIRAGQLDLSSLMNFMVIFMVIFMGMRMVDKALEAPEERPKMLYPGKPPPGYKPVHHSSNPHHSSPGRR